MHFPPCPNLHRTPPGEHTRPRPLADAHQLGHHLCTAAGSLAVFAVLLFLIDLYAAGALVLGLAAVLTAGGAALIDHREPPAGQCDRWLDAGPRSPWGRCTLRRGHQGTCVP